MYSQENSIPKDVYRLDDKIVVSYDFDGLNQILNQTDDHIYVINFWATWCGPCVEELPAFEALHQKYQHDGVRVILVSLDMKKQVQSKLMPFIVKKNIQSKVIYLDDINFNDWIDKVDQSWSGAIPATLICNKKTRLFFERSFIFTELEEQINLLKNTK